MSDLEKLRAGMVRRISTKRRRYLVKKGIACWFSVELDCYVREGIKKNSLSTLEE